MSANESQKQLSQKELEDLVIENDTGARRPDSKFQTGLLTWTAICWALFQLWIASPLMFIVGQWQIGGFRLSGLVFDDTRARSIHLGFAIILAFLAYPASRRSPRNYIPFLDWIFAVAGCFCALYLYLFYDDLAARSGLPTQFDIIAACIGMLLLLEATRRSLGPPLLIVATVFLCYTFFGSMDWVPDVIKTKSQSLPKVASHQWLTTEGVYGIALGVSTSFVFLFVLFGALLERAGAGNYFIKVAFSLLGHLRGGPAKAAVLSSGLTGLISGSSIANTVTTGTFTIPLMKRVGFSGEKAGAVEVASSVNGQIMPPVMGAAAFLMVEYVGIPYVEVIKHAFIPAIISYIALLYIVHLEALKANMQPIPKRITVTLKQRLIAWGIIISSTVIFSYMAYQVISWLSGILKKKKKNAI
ncbi:MAG: TRAP transporter permease, partial [Rickettsiales bacterium]|nr:TRAP transporter permease [Rickettsiales bacterium]